MNLANKLTMIRVALIPFMLLALYLLPAPWNMYVGVGLFVVASLTDFVDGHIARSRNLITDFGKFMDPLADKLLVAAAMIYMTEVGLVAAWVTIIIMSREFVVSGIRLVAASNGTVLAASIWGKIKTAVTMVMIIWVMLDFPGALWHTMGLVLIGVATFFTLLSGFDYVYKNWRMFEGKM